MHFCWQVTSRRVKVECGWIRAMHQTQRLSNHQVNSVCNPLYDWETGCTVTANIWQSRPIHAATGMRCRSRWGFISFSRSPFCLSVTLRHEYLKTTPSVSMTTGFFGAILHGRTFWYKQLLSDTASYYQVQNGLLKYRAMSINPVSRSTSGHFKNKW